MTSIPTRRFEVWKSSLAHEFEPISGVFAIDVVPTLMVRQTLQFLHELGACASGDFAPSVLMGMRYFNPEDPKLLIWKTFDGAEELFDLDPAWPIDAAQQVELHADINLTFSRITYLADAGMGPTIPLLVFQRQPFNRGISLETEERGEIARSLQLGDFELDLELRTAHQHYSTGVALLAGEDAYGGLVDAAFMQFYLSLEAALGGVHEVRTAKEAAKRLLSTDLDQNLESIIEHVYLARHQFFGHSHPRRFRAGMDPDTAFSIARQVLVARWCARRVIEIRLARPLVKREMRLYPKPTLSIAFAGDAGQLKGEFALPTNAGAQQVTVT